MIGVGKIKRIHQHPRQTPQQGQTRGFAETRHFTISHLTLLVLLSLSDCLCTAAVDTAENSFPMLAIDVATDFPLPGGVGGGSGSGGGGGPTSAAAAAAAQKQKTLLQRVDNDIGNIVDNFSYLVNVARVMQRGGRQRSVFQEVVSFVLEVNDPPVRNSQETFMMEMRAARMVQAADSLLKLVSELKQTAIFSGFASLNDHVDQRIDEFNQQAEKTDHMLARIGEEAAASLKELESHYYSSAQRRSQLTQL
ncbi:hypothetical protein TEA_020125 [Camellia sinensis var. sinensis]|uniref:Mediator of RNA polymerase II transcription subunit 22 n=1 Tax=Camellia sinensis var. sinensis TaxID=542762 RepID=A0A4S4DH39_CAMSN|nr:hypothetical protein TEA_020125 [Camellia sinensis var. sinensis]